MRRLFEISGIAGLFHVHPSRNVGFASMAAPAAAVGSAQATASGR